MFWDSPSSSTAQGWQHGPWGWLVAFRADPMPEHHPGFLKTHAGNAAELQGEACLPPHGLCTGKESEPQVTDKAPIAFPLWLSPLCTSLPPARRELQGAAVSLSGHRRWAGTNQPLCRVRTAQPGEREVKWVLPGAVHGPAGTKGLCRSHPSVQGLLPQLGTAAGRGCVP